MVSDTYNHCLWLLDRVTGSTSLFAGECTKKGYQNGHAASFHYPYSVALDVKNRSQLIVADKSNNALRSVDIQSRVVSTLVKMNATIDVRSFTQDKQSGDFMLVAGTKIYRYNYIRKEVSHIAGRRDSAFSVYTDSNLEDSMFKDLTDITALDSTTCLVADYGRIRLVDLVHDKIGTLFFEFKKCGPDIGGLQPLYSKRTPPGYSSLLVINGTLLIGRLGSIVKGMCL